MDELTNPFAGLTAPLALVAVLVFLAMLGYGIVRGIGGS